MKKLKIYKQDGEFVLERINEFNHATKRMFITEQGLLEGLEAYSHEDLSKYDIEVAPELSGILAVIDE